MPKMKSREHQSKLKSGIFSRYKFSSASAIGRGAGGFSKGTGMFAESARKEKKQETALLIEKSRGETVTSENMTGNKIVVVRTSEAGILKVLNARVGQKVKTGQPLATVSTN